MIQLASRLNEGVQIIFLDSKKGLLSQLLSSQSRLDAAMDSASGVVELSDDRAGPTCELDNRWSDWFTLKNASLAQRYLDSDLHLVVRIGRADSQLVAVIKRYVVDDPTSCGSGDGHTGDHCSTFQQATMFPGNVHVMEQDKKFAIVPSVVWLELFDRRNIGLSQPMYFFSSAILPDPIPAGKRTADGKFYVFGSDHAVPSSQGIRKKVKAASDAINDRPDFGIYLPWDCRAEFEFPSLLSRLHIAISDDETCGCLDPGVDPGLATVELGYGPINGRLRV